MNIGDRVLVSVFDGDLETIGVEAIFIGMSPDGKFRTKPAQPRKTKKEFLEWEYCVPLGKK